MQYLKQRLREPKMIKNKVVQKIKNVISETEFEENQK